MKAFQLGNSTRGRGAQSRFGWKQELNLMVHVTVFHENIWLQACVDLPILKVPRGYIFSSFFIWKGSIVFILSSLDGYNADQGLIASPWLWLSLVLIAESITLARGLRYNWPRVRLQLVNLSRARGIPKCKMEIAADSSRVMQDSCGGKCSSAEEMFSCLGLFSWIWYLIYNNVKIGKPVTYLGDTEFNSLYPFTLKNVQLGTVVFIKMNTTGFTSGQTVTPSSPTSTLLFIIQGTGYDWIGHNCCFKVFFKTAANLFSLIPLVLLVILELVLYVLVALSFLKVEEVELGFLEGKH